MIVALLWGETCVVKITLRTVKATKRIQFVLIFFELFSLLLGYTLSVLIQLLILGRSLEIGRFDRWRRQLAVLAALLWRRERWRVAVGFHVVLAKALEKFPLFLVTSLFHKLLFLLGWARLWTRRHTLLMCGLCFFSPWPGYGHPFKGNATLLWTDMTCCLRRISRLRNWHHVEFRCDHARLVGLL